MTAHLHDILELALVRLEAGEELDAILAAYPEHVARLQPLLQTAQMARKDSIPEISPQVINHSRTQVLARAMQLRQTDQPGRIAWGGTRRLAIALVIALAFLLSWGGLMAASAQALPGDQLYSAKLTLEKVRLGLTFSHESHQQVEAHYQSRRVDEVLSLLELGRIELVEFHGVVEKQEKEEWVVSSVPVQLNATTIRIGYILPGMTVEVEGLTQLDGSVQASEIHLQTFGFVGFVESIQTHTWRIGGRTVQITPDSRISSEITVGDWVVVSVRSDDFGNLTALLITASDLPTPTPTSLPTAIPVPSHDPLEMLDEAEKDDNEDDSGEKESEDLSVDGDDDEIDHQEGGEGDDGDESDQDGEAEKDRDHDNEKDREEEEDKDDD
jgi:hypothetical protein